MDQQKGLFGFLENHVMEPMGKLAQFKVVRAITAAGMAAVPFTIVGSMFLVFSILPQAFSFWPVVMRSVPLCGQTEPPHLINSPHFIWLLTMQQWVRFLFILFFRLRTS